ncbi:hypothetical protein [Haloarchaeobius sp. TZWWS8]|uniref:hypothetical protein n=1 Tax=Haloarchaeobius sp. TZWWS8 TaxID=3446121 RepID=UPI003EB86556
MNWSLASRFLFVGLVLLTAGCLGGGTTEPGTDDRGILMADVEPEPPTNATVVDAEAAGLTDTEPLATVLEEAATTNRSRTSLTPAQRQTVLDALADVPRHEGRWYVRYEGRVIELGIAYPD